MTATARALRWLLALASVPAALGLAFACAVQGTGLLDRLCPPELMVSGFCTAAWYSMLASRSLPSCS